MLCRRLRPNCFLAFPKDWEAAQPPWGQRLDDIIDSLETEIYRRAHRAKAERLELWGERVRETNGRRAAIYARAADCSPTIYLRTPTQGSEEGHIYCPS